MKLIDIGYGYRVTDADAGKLAAAVGRQVPKRGYELDVIMPHGEEAILRRTPMKYGVYDDDGKLAFLPPKRGWIWYVTSKFNESLSHYTKASPVKRKAALRKAKEAALHARELERKLTQHRISQRTGRILVIGQARNARLRRAAVDAYLVAADAYEEAGDMLLARRYQKNAELLTGRGLSGELSRRDQKKPARGRHKKLSAEGRRRRNRRRLLAAGLVLPFIPP